MTEHSDILNRLRRLASVPVDDAVAQRHLSTLADVAAPAPSRRGRVVVMGAVVAGTMLGSATLAGAVTGNLPSPAQDVAHTAFAKVGIEVPKANGKDKAKAAKADDTDGPGRVERFLGDATTPCTLPDGTEFVGNHGEYVKAHPDDPATADVNERELAAQSPCGKPVQAGGDGADATETGDDKGRKPAGTGRPDSPGKSEDQHRPDDAGKPSTDDSDAVDSDAVDTDDTDTDADDTGTEDGTDNSGKGSSSSSKGRSGDAPKAPDADTPDVVSQD